MGIDLYDLSSQAKITELDRINIYDLSTQYKGELYGRERSNYRVTNPRHKSLLAE